MPDSGNSSTDAGRFVIEMITSSQWHMDTLHAVAELDLQDWWVGAGFIRNAVWDRLHGYESFTPLTDIDVIYFDRENPDKENDSKIEQRLGVLQSERHWSVRNQARMHLRNGDIPYTSSEDAMCHWLETSTCVGVCLNDVDSLLIVAPYGLSDLIDLNVRPTSSGTNKPDVYRNRIEEKNWVATWPKLTIHMPE